MACMTPREMKNEMEANWVLGFGVVFGSVIMNDCR